MSAGHLVKNDKAGRNSGYADDKKKLIMKDKYRHILDWFSQNMPIAESELHFYSAYQLLIAVILSAQCTDKRINMVTPSLFERFPHPEDLASASFDEVLSLIKSVSFPNNKAKHLIGMAQVLVNDYGGIVPDDIEKLQKMPGVGRKTANVVASIIFNKPVIAVDTHVFRVSHRLGLSRGKTVLDVENDLTKGIPADLRPKAHHWLILHGRYVCTARKPHCSECGIAQFCDYFKQNS